MITSLKGFPNNIPEESEELPEGWCTTELRQVVVSQKGKKPKTLTTEPRDGFSPYILIDQMEGKPAKQFTDDKRIPMASDSDILIVWDGSIGKTANGISGAIGSTIASLTPIMLEPSYLEFFLRLCKPYIEQNSRGSGLQHINPDVFWTIRVPLAPTAEQKRIVAKIEGLLPGVKATKERLKRASLIMKRFRQAVLSAACTGRLTEGWRDANRHPYWETRRIGEMDIHIQTGPFGSMVHKNDYILGGTPLVNPMHIHDGAIYASPNCSVSERKAKELFRYLLKEGDVILGRRGEMGRSAVVKKEHTGFLCGTGSLLLRFDQKNLDADFVSIFFRSPETVAELEQASVGSTMTNLNQRIICSLQFPLPCLAEQKEIVHRVGILFELAGAIEKRIQTARVHADKLTQSILAKAFRGELISTEAELARQERRYYEPAAVLLERIRATRKQAKQHWENKGVSKT